MTSALRVVCDIQATQSIDHGARGIARYAAEHAAGMLAVAPEAMAGLLLNRRFTMPPAAERFIASGLLRWSDRRDPLLTHGPLVYHVMSPFELGIPLEELWPVAVRRPDVRLAVTLYDLIPLIYPDPYLQHAGLRARYMARLQMLRAADIVLAISDSARADAIRLLGIDPARVAVIDAGVTGRFRCSGLDRQALEQRLVGEVPGLRPGYFLYTGGVDFRKNMEGLIRAHGALAPALRARHQLVIVCRMNDHQREHYLAEARRCGSEDDVLLTGYVSDDTLHGLYEASRVFVFPSFYEGFGLPIVEAVACGAPVIASARSSLPEVTPSGEGLFDPESPGQLTAMLARAAEDDAFIARLREASARADGMFTWRRTAELSIAAFRERWDARPARPRPRPRIAIVTPYPPDRSGIARYSRSLMEALAAHCDVDCFVGGDPAGYDAPPAGCTLHDAATLPTMAGLVRYDGVLHCMGNNHMHGFVMRAARQVPGTILCHDIRLVRYHLGRPDGRTLVQALRDQYGSRLPPSLNREDVDHLAVEAAGLWMLGDVIRAADRVLVHSEYAREVVRLEAAGADLDVEVAAVPFGYDPLPAAGGDRQPSRAPGTPLIASFGLVDPIKRADVLVRALPLIRDRHPGATLAFVGPVDPVYARELRMIARAAGVAGALVISGPVDGPTYRRWMALADVGVQLRAMSQGEASLTVAESLAAGLPTVITRAGWMAEIPERAAVGVAPDADAGDLAAAVAQVLDDQHRWRMLRDEGRAWARRNTFARIAPTVLEAVTATP